MDSAFRERLRAAIVRVMEMYGYRDAAVVVADSIMMDIETELWRYVEQAKGAGDDTHD